LEFFKKRIRQYQEKKLNEILDNIKFNEYAKIQLEQQTERSDNYERKLSHHTKMIEIWKDREQKLREQMSDMEEQK